MPRPEIPSETAQEQDACRTLCRIVCRGEEMRFAYSARLVADGQAVCRRMEAEPRAEQYIGDAPFPNFVLTEVANCWQDFLDWSSELQGSWCYRGQRESCWSLLTSLDRAVRRNISKTLPMVSAQLATITSTAKLSSENCFFDSSSKPICTSPRSRRTEILRAGLR